MEELDYEADSFEDILARDHRYAAKAYTLLLDVIHFLGQEKSSFSGEEVLEEFRSRTLDLFGPLSFRVLDEWGVHRCEDVGEMMFNLVETHRIAKDPEDTSESFSQGYDFRKAFWDPFSP